VLVSGRVRVGDPVLPEEGWPGSNG
jgi:hypothetical protein